MNTLVLGIGNLLLADEGVGVQVAQALMKQSEPPKATVLDIGTSILDALPYLETADRVIVVDAMKADGKAGSVYRIGLEDCVQKKYLASMHGFDLPRVLSLTRRKDAVPVTVIGVEPARIEWSLELSPEVSAVFPEILRIVKDEINRTELVPSEPGDSTPFMNTIK